MDILAAGRGEEKRGGVGEGGQERNGGEELEKRGEEEGQRGM